MTEDYTIPGLGGKLIRMKQARWGDPAHVAIELLDPVSAPIHELLKKMPPGITDPNHAWYLERHPPTIDTTAAEVPKEITHNEHDA